MIDNHGRDACDIAELRNVTDMSEVEFESKLASLIHPGMHSFPTPLGERYSNVDGTYSVYYILYSV